MRPMRAPYRPFDSEIEKPAPINWRRGMLRIWVLASAAWIMGWVLYLLIDGLKVGFSANDLIVGAVVLLGPPLALLLFGIATRWAFRGFTAEDHAAKGVTCAWLVSFFPPHPVEGEEREEEMLRRRLMHRLALCNRERPLFLCALEI